MAATGRRALVFLLAALACGPARAEFDFHKVDDLYWRRDEPGKLEENVSRLEALAKDNPSEPALLWRLGRGLMRAGEKREEKKDKLAAFQRAEDFLNKSIALDDRDPEAHFWLGVTMGRRGQARGIMNSLFIVGPLKKEMQTVLRLDPKHGGAHHVLGELYAQLPGFAGGSRKKALSEFEAAVALSPDYAVNYVSLAEAYAGAGQKDKARAVLERLFALKDPTDPAEYPDNVNKGRKLLAELGN